uniref:Uncharacterized protein n=1 Tax=Climaconeis cf. scalaris TaxID=2846828 RepID=A0A8F8SR94_9STRA|nr:hypothetical protein [Climaconeis cf. scalaris]QYB19146.1 hypothetical protein [Climaconeis cf. scalaris]
MKIFRYLIFMSILSAIFFAIYRQSDKKGFHKFQTSFKLAVIIAASAAGLMPVNTHAIEAIENNKVILVKRGDSSPSVPTQTGRGQPNNFPTSSTGGRRTPHVNPYRTPPRVVDQGLGAGANPAGAGGGAAEFDDDYTIPKKEQLQESKTFDSKYRSKNKRKSDDQCSLDENTPNKINEINEKFDSRAVKKLIKTALENRRVKQEYEGIKKRINEGVNPI